MLRSLITSAAGVLLGAVCFAQSAGTETGAKAIFINSLTNEETVSSTSDKPSSTNSSSTNADKISASREVPAVTGVMYYVELLRPSGELMRVNSDRVFHTGDRIRLHLDSNVNGNLVIYQSENGSKPELLFPSGKLSGRVAKGSDVVIPSTHSWFVFNEHPGQIHLNMELTADGSQGPKRTSPAPAEDTRTLLADAGKINDLHEAQKGSKALKIETDDSPADASRVVVVDSRRDSKIPRGQIAVEVTLVHRS